MKAKEQEKVLKILEIVKKIMKLLLKSYAGFSYNQLRGAGGGGWVWGWESSYSNRQMGRRMTNQSVSSDVLDVQRL